MDRIKVILGCTKKNFSWDTVKSGNCEEQTQPAEKVNFRLEILKCKGKSRSLLWWRVVVVEVGEGAQSACCLV